MLDLSFAPEDIPPQLRETSEDVCAVYSQYCKMLLQGLKSEICAVRFQLLHFALLGERGIGLLTELLKYASSQGYYTLLAVPGIMSDGAAAFGAQRIVSEGSLCPCDGVQLSVYAGSDVLKPFLTYCEQAKKDLFVAVRTAHRSSAEIQDLLAGSRMVHMAGADLVNRYADSTIGKYKYSRVGIMVSATAGDSVKMLRAKYPNLFVLVDGLEYPGANGKNCAYAFDKMGHGAVICLASSITAAWKDGEGDFVQAAADAAQKMKKRIQRYVTVL